MSTAALRQEKVSLSRYHCNTNKNLYAILSSANVKNIGCNTISDQKHGLTLCLPVSSADNLGKQLGPKSGPTNRRTRLGSKLFDILIVLVKVFFPNVNFEKNKQQTTKSVKNYPVCNELKPLASCNSKVVHIS